MRVSLVLLAFLFLTACGSSDGPGQCDNIAGSYSMNDGSSDPEFTISGSCQVSNLYCESVSYFIPEENVLNVVSTNGKAFCPSLGSHNSTMEMNGEYLHYFVEGRGTLVLVGL